MNSNDLAMLPDIAAEVADPDPTPNIHPQTGPLTEAGKDVSKRNAVRHGLTGAGVVLPEGLRQSVDRLRDEFVATYSPVDDDDLRLIGQAALGFARFQAAVDEQTYYIADRSEQALASWGEAEAASAEKLGNRLASRPAWVVGQLMLTLAGCRWLLQQWRWLVASLDHSGTWDDDRQARALHLLGIATIDHEADRSVVRGGTPEERRALASEQVATLEARLSGDLASIDANRRDRAIEGRGYLLEPGYLKLVRYENAALRMYERAIAELKARRVARGESDKPASVAKAPAVEMLRPAMTPPAPEAEDVGPTPPPGYANYTLEAIEGRMAAMDAWMAQEYPRAFANLQALGDEDEDDDEEEEEGDGPRAPELSRAEGRRESRQAKRERLRREREARKRSRRR
ncbi:MAG: hypothetical protein U0800_17690 [Isosphaeraceae bacterium]